MKTLLINPDSPYLENAASYPPMGLLYVAAALQKEGCKVSVLDFAAEPDIRPPALQHINHISDVIDTMEATGTAWCYNTIMLKGEHIRTAEPILTKWVATSRLDNIILRFPKICEKLLKHRNPVNSSSLMFDMDEYRRNNLSWSGGKARSVCDGIILRQMFQKRLRGVALHSLGAFYREHDKQFSKTGQYMREHEDFRKEVT